MARARDDEPENAVLREVWRDVLRRDPHQEFFHSDVRGVLRSIGPVLVEHPEYTDVVGRLCEPERVIVFRVPWVDDSGRVRVNRGFRVQFNSALGPYKGGLRFAPSVDLDVVKFLGFEQVFKNALTGQDIGGGKGGADVDPKALSTGELMRFCQSFATELASHVGGAVDVPAGDMGVGSREIGWIYGQYQRLIGYHEPGAFTGKPAVLGGSALRPEATGYGAVYFTRGMLDDQGRDLDGARVVVSGSGSVALHAMAKVIDSGGTVVGCSDSRGSSPSPTASTSTSCARSRARAARWPTTPRSASGATAREGSPFTQEVRRRAALRDAERDRPRRGARARRPRVLGRRRGRQRPVTPEAREILREGGVGFGPGKAANAGGVAVSALEMQQAAGRERWSAEDVDARLSTIMSDAYDRVREAAERYHGDPGDLENGANAAGFLRVAEAMTALGVV